eukprot:6019227-Prymnesium_polylepis.1
MRVASRSARVCVPCAATSASAARASQTTASHSSCHTNQSRELELPRVGVVTRTTCTRPPLASAGI